MNAKKLLFLPMIFLGMVFFIQCSEDPYFAETDDAEPQSALKAGKGGGGHTEVATNNLSFPAIAVDGFGISPVSVPTFEVMYDGLYPGIDPAQITYLELNGPWYPQKTVGNTWQAENASSTGPVKVSFIDWGDVIESVNPKIRRPFRLEVTLYKALSNPMDAYTMAELEYPSSSKELQGTNAKIYDSYLATVVSSKPKLVIQFLDDIDHEDLWWDETDFRWKVGDETPTVIPITFSTELNVGGKYIYGASQGGWKPTVAGYYRITFYCHNSNVDLSEAVIDNYANQVVITQGMRTIILSEDEGGAANPVVRGDLNLTYVDVLVVAGGGSGKP